MKLSCTTVQVYPKRGRFAGPSGVRAAVSLHSHSDCSRETLGFVPHVARRIPLVSAFVERSLATYERTYGVPLDFGNYHWRPPLSAAAVIASERAHLEHRLEAPAIVSLTDHDTFEGPKRLRASGQTDVPLSVEWSVPFGGTVFHLGVHAVAPARITETERVLGDYTAGRGGDLAEIFDWICETPDTFIVINHPYWDMSRLGTLRHDTALLTFMRLHRHRIHAVELNGYRAWAENRRALPLAEGFGLPVVGGGDRHGRSPNTIVNLTSASCLAEFARDLRAGKSTYCVVFPEYTEPFGMRLLRGAAECMAPDPLPGGGTRSWSDRVFGTIDGRDVPVSAQWNSTPVWLQAAIGITRLLGSNAIRPVFQVTQPQARTALEREIGSEQFFAGGVHTVAALEALEVSSGVGDSLSRVTP